MRSAIVGFLIVGFLLLGVPSRVAAADLDCANFGTQEGAEQALKDDGGVDINGLDADNDGAPCERLPSGQWYATVAALLTAFVTLLLVQMHYSGRGLEGAEWVEVLVGPFLMAIPGYALVPELVKRVAPHSAPPMVYALVAGVVTVAAVVGFKAYGNELRRPTT